DYDHGRDHDHDHDHDHDDDHDHDHDHDHVHVHVHVEVQVQVQVQDCDVQRRPCYMSPVREPELRRLLVEICHRMYRQGYIAAGDGNVSAKLDDGERVLVTPTGFHKGFIKE